MDYKFIYDIVGVSASPAMLAVVGYFIVEGIKKEIKSLKEDFTELKNSIHNNGFVRKDVLESMIRGAEELREADLKNIDDKFKEYNLWIRKIVNKVGD